MSEAPRVGRRDFLSAAVVTGVGIGVLGVLWVLVSAMTPTADVRAQRKMFRLVELMREGYLRVSVDGRPVLIFLRSAVQQRKLSEGRPPEGSRKVADPDWAQNWHRSRRPEIMVCSGACTRESCVISIQPEGVLFCPCCSARYDLAGRAVSGPAPRDLDVPAYRFVGDTDIEFN